MQSENNKNLKKTALALLFLATFVVFNVSVYERLGQVHVSRSIENSDLSASIFFVDSVTEKSLKEVFQNAENNKDKVRVLVVPGHDKSSWGTQFGSLKEVELNIALGQELFNLIKKDKRFDVQISQTAEGYTPEFSSYFENNRASIFEFIKNQKQMMGHFVGTGEIKSVVHVDHNFAPAEVAFRLFGMNKWANENKIDIVIHIHFNDYPGRRKVPKGKYSGFSLYVPEKQFSNSKGSIPLAESIRDRLAVLYPQSNLPVESAGVIEDQELIAIGSNNSLDSAVVLIEYGYIYEPFVTNPDIRTVALPDLALQTYAGMLDFFDADTEGVANRNRFINTTEAAENKNHKVMDDFETRFFPYEWKYDLEIGDPSTEGLDRDVASLQVALILEGIYPPDGKSKNECGITGYFGKCTEKGVREFQKKYNIIPATGIVGEKTRQKLNQLY